MRRDVVIFLDLEQTLIDGWWEGRNLLHHKVDKVKKFIDCCASDLESNIRVGLMSWAVHNEKDRQVFIEELQPHLETLLGREFDEGHVLTMADWAKLVFQQTGTLATLEDMFEICKKEEILFMLIRKGTCFQNMSIMLIDDAVVEFEMNVASKNADLKVANVDMLP